MFQTCLFSIHANISWRRIVELSLQYNSRYILSDPSLSSSFRIALTANTREALFKANKRPSFPSGSPNFREIYSALQTDALPPAVGRLRTINRALRASKRDPLTARREHFIAVLFCTKFVTLATFPIELREAAHLRRRSDGDSLFYCRHIRATTPPRRCGMLPQGGGTTPARRRFYARKAAALRPQDGGTTPARRQFYARKVAALRLPGGGTTPARRWHYACQAAALRPQGGGTTPARRRHCARKAANGFVNLFSSDSARGLEPTRDIRNINM
jgi:hypothetical protein